MRAALLLLFVASASAQSPLDAVADALGGQDRVDALETLVLSARVDVVLEGEDRRLRSTQTLRFPDAMRWDVRVSGRVRSVVLNRGEAFSVIEGEDQPLAVEAALDVAAESWLHPVVLVARRSEVFATELSPGLIRVEIDDLEDDILVGLDARGRPDLLTTQRRRGDVVSYIAVRLSDYREVDGLMVPHQVTQTVSGVKTGSLSLDRVEVDGDVPPATFERTDTD